jgi:hypothetical protein
MSDRQFYSIQAKADDVAEVWIYDQIGASFWSEGVTAKQFVTELAAIKALHHGKNDVIFRSSLNQLALIWGFDLYDNSFVSK